MNITSAHSCDTDESAQAPTLRPLDQETRAVLTTREAAHHLNRRPQTLRCWAMNDGTGPIRPIRINGRLAWPTAEIRRVLGLAT